MRWLERVNVYPPRLRGAGPEQWVEDLIAYAEQYTPDFGQRLRGASEEDLAALEQAVGRPLPASYRRFLSAFGHDSGGLLTHFTASFRLPTIQAAYAAIGRGEEPAPTNDRIICARGSLGRFDELSLEPVDGSPEPRVVITSGRAQEPLRLARSLPRLLFVDALRDHEMAAFPVAVDLILRDGTHTLQRVAVTAREVGFTPYWFNDETHWGGWTEEGALLARKLAGRDGWIRIAARDNAPLGRYRSHFDLAMGVRFRRKLHPKIR